MTAGLVDQLGQHVLGMAEVADQPLIRLGFLDRVQILALDIFDQRDLERGGVVEVAHDNRDFMETRALGGAPAALTGNDLIGAAVRADNDGLDHAARGDRGREFVQRGFIETAAGLAGVGR